MGYIVIESALSPEELARLTAEIDRAEAEEGGLPEYPRCAKPLTDPTVLGLLAWLSGGRRFPAAGSRARSPTAAPPPSAATHPSTPKAVPRAATAWTWAG